MPQNLSPVTMAGELRQPIDERTRDDAARVALIERSILVLLVVVLLIGVLAVVKPFTTAILFGASLATAAWPIRQALVRRGLGHGSAAALLLLVPLVIVVLPMLAFAPHLADQIVRGTQRLQSYFAATPERPACTGALPLGGRRLGAAWDRVVEVKGNLKARWSLHRECGTDHDRCGASSGRQPDASERITCVQDRNQPVAVDPQHGRHYSNYTNWRSPPSRAESA